MEFGRYCFGCCSGVGLGCCSGAGCQNCGPGVSALRAVLGIVSGCGCGCCRYLFKWNICHTFHSYSLCGCAFFSFCVISFSEGALTDITNRQYLTVHFEPCTALECESLFMFALYITRDIRIWFQKTKLIAGTWQYSDMHCAVQHRCAVFFCEIPSEKNWVVAMQGFQNP